MLRSLLVGLNGSPDTPAVIDFAVRTAQRADALLAVTSLVDIPTITQGEAVPLGGAAFKYERDAERITKARRLAEDAVQRFAQQAKAAGVRYTLVPPAEDPRAQISEHAPRFDAIILGHLGVTDGAQARDPVLEHVLHHAARPVISVPGSLGTRPAILIAYDGSLQAARALQLFTSVWHPLQELHVVSVDKQQTIATHHAEMAREYLRRHAVEPTTHAFATNEAPQDVILETVRRLSPEMLVMGAYGKPSWREFFFGTVTKALLAQNVVPMFLYH